jgi:phosphate starvation-inducible protein PhoH and related proteins
MVATQRLTRKQKRLSERAENVNYKGPSIKPQNFNLKQISPITENQVKTFKAYASGNNLFLHGCAGTGKTFISLYLALQEVLSETTDMNRVVIIRNAQSSKDIGFLPGNEKQKLEVYESAYRAICSELFHRDDAYDIFKQKKIIEFHSTSFLRGSTIDNAIIIVDEVQNQRYSEIRTVLTRTGEGSRVILCGDTKQDDLTSERYKEASGLRDIMHVFDRMGSIQTVQFGIDDIVRSGFVRDFIVAENELGLY